MFIIVQMAVSLHTMISVVWTVTGISYMPSTSQERTSLPSHPPTQSSLSNSSLAVDFQDIVSTETVARHSQAVTSKTTPGHIAQYLSKGLDSNVKSQFAIDANDCSRNVILTFNSTEGLIKGFTNKHNMTITAERRCFFRVIVPPDLHLIAYSVLLCHYRGAIVLRVFLGQEMHGVGLCSGHVDKVKLPLLLMPHNILFAQVHYDQLPVGFWLYFKAVAENLRDSFNVVKDSGSNGHMTLHGYDQGIPYAVNLDLSYTLQLPPAHVLVLSVPHFGLYYAPLRVIVDDILELYLLSSSHEQRKLWTKRGTTVIDADVFKSSMRFRFVAGFDRDMFGIFPVSGFRIMFSFHPDNEAPVKLPSGLFNCSRDYDKIRFHLDCNVRVECENQEDETEKCPFSSAQCQGAVHVENKCISYGDFGTGKYNTWRGARKICQSGGGDLATMKTQTELEKVFGILKQWPRSDCVFIGLQKANLSSDNMYRGKWLWTDETTSYEANFTRQLTKINLYKGACTFIKAINPGVYYRKGCLSSACNTFLCEKKLDSPDVSTTMKPPVLLNTTDTLTEKRKNQNPLYVRCPDGHVVHEFLSCDPDSRCKTDRHVPRCALVTHGSGTMGEVRIDDSESETARLSVHVEMFQCHEYGGTIPYTLVCDFRKDCADNSDEKHCKHKDDTTAFRCKSGQHIPQDKICDQISECLDNSDETDCDNHHADSQATYEYRNPPPKVLYLDGRNGFIETAMDPDDPCPETHFRCPHPVYCMPVFLRCNGVKDCPYGEDELGCEAIACPGYYRCRGSRMCLHPSHVCDGWPQCPQRDDELLCNASCPSVCQCQGLAFVCHRPFPAMEYPDLRYLDGKGSGIAPQQLSESFYLIYLSLPECGVTSWPIVDLQNVQTLDLSHNRISVLSIQHLTVLQNLIVLCLKDNPLKVVMGGNYRVKQNSLSTLDLSQTDILQFDSTDFVSFPVITSLNISFSRLRTVSEHGFEYLPLLTNLDLRGCTLETYPRGLFRSLSSLRSLHVDNYKLCCGDMLPNSFDIQHCIAPLDIISSCEELLRSKVYVPFVWVIGIFSLIGNSGCLIFTLLQDKSNFKIDYTFTLIHLNLADFLMGVYLLIIGSADSWYRGVYEVHESTWRNSVLCKIAGFLCLLSRKASAFMISLLAIDRFSALFLPLSTRHLKGRSVIVSSVLAWVTCLVLSAIPLQTHWDFYGQTGICIPLPNANKASTALTYSFGVTTVLPFVLFVFIAVGQAFISWTLRANAMKGVSATDMSRDLTVARRLFSVVLFDCLCWISFGVLGMADFHGTPVSGGVHVTMALVVLPLNSTANPLLYAFNMLSERQRKAKEARISQFLQARMKHKQQSTAGSHIVSVG